MEPENSGGGGQQVMSQLCINKCTCPCHVRSKMVVRYLQRQLTHPHACACVPAVEPTSLTTSPLPKNRGYSDSCKAWTHALQKNPRAHAMHMHITHLPSQPPRGAHARCSWPGHRECQLRVDTGPGHAWPGTPGRGSGHVHTCLYIEQVVLNQVQSSVQ